MSNMLKQEQACYEEMWQVPSYDKFSPGEEFLPLFLEHAQAPETVLDAGCGGGAGSIALVKAGFDVEGFDITEAGLRPEFKELEIPFTEGSLWRPLPFAPKSVDWVYCTDVMEHIPPQFTMLVASQLLSVARKGVFFSIGLTPDQFGVWVGRPLHLSVYSFKEWRDNLSEIGQVVDARDLMSTGIYVVRS